MYAPLPQFMHGQKASVGHIGAYNVYNKELKAKFGLYLWLCSEKLGFDLSPIGLSNRFQGLDSFVNSMTHKGGSRFISSNLIHACYGFARPNKSLCLRQLCGKGREESSLLMQEGNSFRRQVVQLKLVLNR